MPASERGRDLPLGQRFQSGSKHHRGVRMPGAGGGRPGPRTNPALEDLVALPDPKRADGPGLWGVIAGRRSVRRYGDQPLVVEDLSQLLWACQGITAQRGDFSFRAAPSAGAQYPIDTYVVAGAVAGLAAGIYRYMPEAHALTLVRSGDLRQEACSAAMDQGMVREAQLLLVWTATFARSQWRYGERCYRYAYLDAGHIAQNLALAAVGLELASCQIAAYYDDEADALVGADGRHETVVYMSVVGRPLHEGT